MSSYPEDDHHHSGCFGLGRSRRNTPSSGSSHRGFFSFGQGGRTVLPPLSSAFRSSRSTVVPEHLSASTHPDLQETRGEYNPPSNDPTIWPGYSTIGQQSSFAAYDNDPRQHQYSYPAPQQIPYPSFSRDPASSYSINPQDSRILPPINVNSDRWQSSAYTASSVGRTSEDIYSPSPVEPYPSSSYLQYSSHLQMPPPHHADTTLSIPSSIPMPGSSNVHPSGSHSQRTISERSSHSRNSHHRGLHATSPYARHPPHAASTPEPSQVKKKRKRADAAQLKVLNEVYARTAFPSTEERHKLAEQLNMTQRSVQIWFQNKRQSMRNANRLVVLASRVPEPDHPAPNPPHPSTNQQSASSRSAQHMVAAGTIAPVRSGSSIASHSQSTYIPPSPTDPYAGSRSVQMPYPGQPSTSHRRPPSRSREPYGDYYEGSRRSR